MSIQSIKNTKLRRAVLLTFGPPVVVVGFFVEFGKFLAEFIQVVVTETREAWNG